MTPATTNSYDAVPYPTIVRRSTHPDTLAVAATLAGMPPAAVDRCRVLELGCGTGGNLITLAAALPGSRFVGVDLSPVQIAEARQTAGELGLSNVEFHAASITAIDDSWGRFDYAICHGVYSWVPPAVQEHILRVCGRNLSANGVAMVSYNTYPGWRLREIVRDAMTFAARNAPDPSDTRQQVRAGREYVAFLAAAAPVAEYSGVLRPQAEALAEEQDHYLFHEYLEADNRPVYFAEFAARAAAGGLQYLAEVPPHRPLEELSAEAREVVRAISTDLISQEQHTDFLLNKSFRRTMLCRADARLERSVTVEVLDRMLASAWVQPDAPDPDVTSAEPVSFTSGRSKVTFTTGAPVTKAALAVLNEAWPRPLPVPELAARVADRLGAIWAKNPAAGRAELGRMLLDGYLADIVGLHTHIPDFTRRPGDRPVGFPVARLLAPARESLPNLLHAQVRLPPLERFVLRLLDGTRDRAAVAAALADAVRAGDLVPPPGGPAGSPDDWAGGALAVLAETALLVA